MAIRRAWLALATVITALAGASTIESAAAANPGYSSGASYFQGGGFLYRAPQPNRSLPSARSPAYGIPQALPGSKMNRSGMGGGRMNGGMSGRR
jgi:hypothetical protein